MPRRLGERTMRAPSPGAAPPFGPTSRIVTLALFAMRSSSTKKLSVLAAKNATDQ
jgi:hypothetical protein